MRPLKLLLAALLLWFGQAQASIPTVSGYKVDYYAAGGGHAGGSGTVYPGPGRDAACASAEAVAVAVLKAQFAGRSGGSTGMNGVNCYAYAGDGTYVGAVGMSAASGACPVNSSASGGACQCNSGYHEEGTSCVVNPTSAEKWKNWCQAASGQSLGFVEMPGRNVRTGCQNITLAGSPIDTPGYVPGEVPQDAGCSITLGNMKSFPDADGSYYTQGDASVTGGTCREGEPAAGDPEGTEKQPEAKPPACVDGYAGEVNGSTVCAKADPTKGIDWTGRQSTTNPDGTTTTTDTQTSCKGNTCTTTSTRTTTSATGTVTGTETTSSTETRGALCARDKGNGACTGAGVGGNGDSEGSSFTGNCESGFVVKGDDAVLNAMALEQHKRNCLMYGDPDGQPQEIPKQTKTATLGTVSVGGWGSSCPSPMTFIFWGQSFELSFQALCESAPLVRPFVLLACGLMSMFIVYYALRGSQ